MRRLQWNRSIIACLVAALMLLGIGGTVVAQEGTPEDGTTFPVQVTFVNGMTSLESVDVYINGDDEDQRVVEGLEYGTVSESFEGSAPATLVVIKQNVNLGFDRYIFDTLVPTEAGKSYVIVISDLLILPVELDLTATGDDTARSIGVHAAAQAPAVDIYVTPSGQQFSIGDVVPLITDLSYGNATAGGPALPGSYDLRLTQTGTDTVALEQAGVEVEAGNSYVFAIIGKPGSSEQPLTVLSVSEPTM